MKRNHIHFAPDVPGGQEIISGMLLYCVVCVCACVRSHACVCACVSTDTTYNMYNTIL